MKARRCPNCSQPVTFRYEDGTSLVACDPCSIQWIGADLSRWPLLTEAEVTQERCESWERHLGHFRPAGV